ncbi:hypothetical protein [Halobaculum lipolyticum]|uniref:Uncharacterized protein n=1 Tax=Halobaculum lipolyticum TaxID=3032001 RepID=A0ABD5W8R0_9EURY|nr:hypothetical protein [Halobaculum sp. DT31]
MSRLPAEDGRTDLESTRTARTLRDTLHELPVDALVPDGWLVGTEVVQFGDRRPADGVTLRHGDYPRDLVITGAGTDDGEALAVHERDRRAGRRTVVAGVPARGDAASELTDGLRAAARAAARIEGGGTGEAAIDRGEPSTSLSGRAGDVEKRLNFY